MSNYTKEHSTRNSKRTLSDLEKRINDKKLKRVKMRKQYKKQLERKRKQEKKEQEKKRKMIRKFNRKNSTKKVPEKPRKLADKTINRTAGKPKTKNISKPKTIPNNRFTEPKKRSLLRRVMLQMKYNSGAFDYIEDEYDSLTKQELEEYRTSKFRSDRSYYKEVQAYEDAYDDVTVRKGWTKFKVGLIALTLTGLTIGSAAMYHGIIKDIHDNAPQPVVIVTLAEATPEQVDIANIDMNLIKNDSEYNFDNLTQEEQLDAVLRIPIVESKINVGRFKNAIIGVNLNGDQELLDEIVIEAFGEEEYSTYSDAKKEDLRKLAYELLDSEKKDWTRDPVALKELRQRQEAERQEREANMREVELRLNGNSQNNQDINDRDDR